MKIHIYPKSMLETVWQQDKLLFIWLRLITRRRDYNAYVHYYLKG